MALATDPIAERGRAPTTAMTGGEIMCEALAAEGVEVLFGYPGGAIMPFYDALYTYPTLRHVLVRHEQAAAHAADGFARVTGRVGVCVATSGPGATNLVTGLANAFMDSVPIVAITGQVARPGIGKDSFQETDVIGVTMPVTKHNMLVETVEDLGPAIHEAFAVARAGRPGPVLIDVPKDVQFEQASYTVRRDDQPIVVHSDVYRERQLRAAARLIDGAERPLILAGHGVILSRAYEPLRLLAERTETPVATTLLGLSAFPESHPLALGMPGMHGHSWANRAINEADVIFAVGMRFDDRVTGKIEEFAPQARIIHVDIEAAELEKVAPTAIPIEGDAGDVMDRLVALVAPAAHAPWLARIGSWRRPATRLAGALPHPVDIFAGIKRASGGRATLVTDVGQNQMWAAQLYGYDLPNTHITSGGLGTMGFALPAAMGVKVGAPQEQVWVVAGDGGIQMNIQELATIADLKIDLKVVVVNNGYLGMVRQWQKFFHGGRYSATPISSPNYLLLAQAYGHQARKVDRADELQEALTWAARTPGCVIVDIAVEQERNVYPMIPSGHSVASMIEELVVDGV